MFFLSYIFLLQLDELETILLPPLHQIASSSERGKQEEVRRSPQLSCYIIAPPPPPPHFQLFPQSFSSSSTHLEADLGFEYDGTQSREKRQASHLASLFEPIWILTDFFVNPHFGLTHNGGEGGRSG